MAHSLHNRLTHGHGVVGAGLRSRSPALGMVTTTASAPTAKRRPEVLRGGQHRPFLQEGPATELQPILTAVETGVEYPLAVPPKGRLQSPDGLGLPTQGRSRGPLPSNISTACQDLLEGHHHLLGPAQVLPSLLNKRTPLLVIPRSQVLQAGETSARHTHPRQPRRSRAEGLLQRRRALAGVQVEARLVVHPEALVALLLEGSRQRGGRRARDLHQVVLVLDHAEEILDGLRDEGGESRGSRQLPGHPRKEPLLPHVGH